MSPTEWALVCLAITVGVYAVAVIALLATGRRDHARALAGFIPDCLVLTHRLLRDPRVPRQRKLFLIALIAYLASPLDLVPDFIPVVGQLDDAILVVLVLRIVLRTGGDALVREHWPGPQRSLAVVLSAGASTAAGRYRPGP
jgi:uncharacterized membrane protein YkvA (DUF1232 family)